MVSIRIASQEGMKVERDRRKSMAKEWREQAELKEVAKTER
jgi:hypothetical protein